MASAWLPSSGVSSPFGAFWIRSGAKPKPNSPKPATFSGTIPLGDREYKLSGQLSNNHLYSTTSTQLLTGKKRMLIAGQFEFNGPSVEVHPFIIGDMMEDLGYAYPISWSRSVRVYVEQIDAFAKIGDA